MGVAFAKSILKSIFAVMPRPTEKRHGGNLARTTCIMIQAHPGADLILVRDRWAAKIISVTPRAIRTFGVARMQRPPRRHGSAEKLTWSHVIQGGTTLRSASLLTAAATSWKCTRMHPLELTTLHRHRNCTGFTTCTRRKSGATWTETVGDGPRSCKASRQATRA